MTQLTIDSEQLDQLIVQRLPTLIQQNAQIQKLVLDLARQNFADRYETDDRFYQLLGELRRDREEQTRKWEKYTAEQTRADFLVERDADAHAFGGAEERILLGNEFAAQFG